MAARGFSGRALCGALCIAILATFAIAETAAEASADVEGIYGEFVAEEEQRRNFAPVEMLVDANEIVPEAEAQHQPLAQAQQQKQTSVVVQMTPAQVASLQAEAGLKIQTVAPPPAPVAQTGPVAKKNLKTSKPSVVAAAAAAAAKPAVPVKAAPPAQPAVAELKAEMAVESKKGSALPFTPAPAIPSTAEAVTVKPVQPTVKATQPKAARPAAVVKPVQATAAPTKAAPQKAVPTKTSAAAAKVVEVAAQGGSTAKAVQAAVPAQTKAPVVVVVKSQAPETKKQLAKKKMEKKLSLAKQFSTLVQTVDTILDESMKRMTQDKETFKKALAAEHKKQNMLRDTGDGAQRDNRANANKLYAIQTHIDLARKVGAKKFISFISQLRKGTKRRFNTAYSRASAKQEQLISVYKKISKHVAHATKAMHKHKRVLQTNFIAALKAYYKVKYSCAGKKPPAVVAKERAAAKKAYKLAFLAKSNFKRSEKKAHHHAHHLRKGLKHAIHKLHFLFRKAKGMYRHATKMFHAGFETRMTAQKIFHSKALHFLKQEEAKNQKHTTVPHKALAARKSSTSKQAASVSHKNMRKDTLKKHVTLGGVVYKLKDVKDVTGATP